jgi:hypothetical protein
MCAPFAPRSRRNRRCHVMLVMGLPLLEVCDAGTSGVGGGGEGVERPPTSTTRHDISTYYLRLGYSNRLGVPRCSWQSALESCEGRHGGLIGITYRVDQSFARGHWTLWIEGVDADSTSRCRFLSLKNCMYLLRARRVGLGVRLSRNF